MSGNRTAICVVLALWALAMMLSGFVLTAEPTGDGFTRGLNRVTGFVAWQAAALILALIAWLFSCGLEAGDRLRWVARIPAWWAMVLLVGLAVLIAVSAWMSNQPPPVTDAPESTAADAIPLE